MYTDRNCLVINACAKRAFSIKLNLKPLHSHLRKAFLPPSWKAPCGVPLSHMDSYIEYNVKLCECVAGVERISDSRNDLESTCMKDL